MTEYKAGYATLPLEKYNELLRRADLPAKLFKVKKGYSDNLELHIDEELMDQIGRELYNAHPLAHTYEYKSPVFWGTTIGAPPPTDEEA